jgi:hypothetical protein
MNNRRSFLKKSAAFLTIIGLAGLSKKSVAGEIALKGTLVHHVFFWLKEPGNKEHRKQFEKALDELLKVKTIKISHVGVPAGTESRDVVDHSYTYSLLVMFNSKEEQDLYQIDPIHQKFVDENSNLWNKVVVYDSVD